MRDKARCTDKRTKPRAGGGAAADSEKLCISTLSYGSDLYGMNNSIGLLSSGRTYGMTVQAHAGTEVRIASVSAGDEVFAALHPWS